MPAKKNPQQLTVKMGTDPPAKKKQRKGVEEEAEAPTSRGHSKSKARSRSSSTSSNDSARSPTPPPTPPAPSASAPPKKREKKKGLILTDEQETLLSDWLKENPMLYTKSMKEFKDTAKKTSMWNDKAAELDLESGALLRTWYESVRSKVGKLTDKKSGSNTKDLTDRDTFLMSNFGFLSKHISRVKATPACSVSRKYISVWIYNFNNYYIT